MQAPTQTASSDLAAFQVIVDFVRNLKEYFGDKVQFIEMYHRLLYKRSFQDVELIQRHVEVFRAFCKCNRAAIASRDTTQFVATKIQFTDRIYLDVAYIFAHVDAETVPIVWEYLLAISAHLDPANNTKQVLQQLQQEHVNNNTSSNVAAVNPMQMVGSIMANPVIGNMMNTFMNSNIDLHQLVQSITPIVENVKKEIEQSEDPAIKNMIAMLQQSLTDENNNDESKN